MLKVQLNGFPQTVRFNLHENEIKYIIQINMDITSFLQLSSLSKNVCAYDHQSIDHNNEHTDYHHSLKLLIAAEKFSL